MAKQAGKRRSKKPSKIRAERTHKARATRRRRELALQREEEERAKSKPVNLKSMLPTLTLPDLSVKKTLSASLPVERLTIPNGLKKPSLSDLEMQK